MSPKPDNHPPTYAVPGERRSYPMYPNTLQPGDKFQPTLAAGADWSFTVMTPPDGPDQWGLVWITTWELSDGRPVSLYDRVQVPVFWAARDVDVYCTRCGDHTVLRHDIVSVPVPPDLCTRHAIAATRVPSAAHAARAPREDRQ